MEIEEREFKPTRDKKETIKFYTKNDFQRIEDTQYLVKNMDYIY